MKLPIASTKRCAAAAVAVLALLAGACSDAPDDAPDTSSPPSLRYDTEYPAVGYSERRPSGRVETLIARLARGDTSLDHTAPRGFLDALLDALDIDPVSQVLVFSRTSLQVVGILPETPRAIFFNDDTYVAWVQGAANIEIATMDPELGPVFYTLVQDDASDPVFEQQYGRCLRCHDSYSLTGGGVPRFIIGSGYIGAMGQIVAHEAWILTTPRTPLSSRWGGWYVSGHHGEQVHLGNIVVPDVAALSELETLRIGNRDDLTGLLDTEPYPTRYSDIVALLVMEHQIAVQNAIARARFDVVTAVDAGLTGAELATAVATSTEPLVRELTMVDEAGLTARVRGTSGFADWFETRGPADSQGRSLRQLDLEQRVFEFPLSFLIYSDAFRGLPVEAHDYIRMRLRAIFNGRDGSADFAHIDAATGRVLIEILRDTYAELAAALD